MLYSFYKCRLWKQIEWLTSADVKLVDAKNILVFRLNYIFIIQYL